VRADYLMIGGFLGAGKTTAMLRLAHHLTTAGRRVGLIANDQSHGLVDTVMLSAEGFAVEEITGGCFCCRFNSLTQAAGRLARKVAPDIFLAEPVGSCTDLRATVQYPLRRLYGAEYRVGPLSVLVDPLRAARVLGLEEGSSFSSKVLYVYRKQLEEADLIAINKCDLLPQKTLQRLEDAMRQHFPAAQVLRMSARTGAGLDGWFRALQAEPGLQQPPTVDYDEYAEGEALLGWLNTTIRLQAATLFDGNLLLRDLAGRIRGRLSADSIEIAHLKMTLTPDPDIGRLGTLNLVGTAREPEVAHLLEGGLAHGELILNLRAEGAPEVLRAAVENSLAASAASAGAQAETLHLEHFRPGRPQPTHRDSS
jgi:Ni2+-binding GTPase involved in maturation of urease and hydrogenase